MHICQECEFFKEDCAKKYNNVSFSEMFDSEGKITNSPYNRIIWNAFVCRYRSGRIQFTHQKQVIDLYPKNDGFVGISIISQKLIRNKFIPLLLMTCEPPLLNEMITRHDIVEYSSNYHQLNYSIPSRVDRQYYKSFGFDLDDVALALSSAVNTFNRLNGTKLSLKNELPSYIKTFNLNFIKNSFGPEADF